MPEARFSYSPIHTRPRLEMPGGARVALWVGANIEYFDFNEPIASLRGETVPAPSPSAFGHYSYGLRVGIFRIMDILENRGLRASVLLNSDVGDHYPEIVAAGNEHRWAWLAHGKRNRISQSSFTSVDAERTYLREMIEAVEKHTGVRPQGWLGPGMSETFDTPDLLAELGLSYVCDWVADDQPFPLAVKSGRMINVPYAVDGLNDMRLRDRGFSGEDYYRLIVDQFDMLYADGAANPRVMCIAIHPHVTGQPFRAKNFDRALEYIVGHDQVWLATSDEIAEWYYAETAPDR